MPFTPPHFLMIGVWPLLMGVTMFLQTKLNPQPADPMQAKVMMMLPLMFIFLFATFPAGLVIYWTWNNLLSITQQWVIMKRMGVATRRPERAGVQRIAAAAVAYELLADDMDYAALKWMPSTLKLIGDAGTTFKRNYVGVALCAPSRATLLTGRYAHNTRVLTVDSSNGGYRQFRNGGTRSRRGRWLRNAGYETAWSANISTASGQAARDLHPARVVLLGGTDTARRALYQQFNYA